MTSPNITHEVSVQEGYTRWAAQYDQEDNPLIVVEEQLTLPLLAAIPVNQVLDIGAGTGRYAIRLAKQGAQVVALDQSEAMLSVARQVTDQAGVQVQFRQHNLGTDLPSESSCFDLVLATLVFCHVENLAGVAREAYRVLHPGGHIMVTDFHPEVIAAGWRTQFTNTDGTYFLPTVGHTRDHYLTILNDTRFRIQTVKEALVRDAPTEAFSANVLSKDGDKPFCLVILASKPIDS